MSPDQPPETPAHRGPAERAPSELAETYAANPDGFKPEAWVFDGGKSCVGRISASELADAYETCRERFGPGRYLVRMQKAKGGSWGASAWVDVAERPSRPPAPPEPSLLPSGGGTDALALQMYRVDAQAREDRLRGELDRQRMVFESDRERLQTALATANAKASELGSELNRMQIDVIGARQKGYQQGFDDGKRHGERVAEERAEASGGGLLSGLDASTLKDLVAGLRAPQAATPKQPQGPRGSDFGDLLRACLAGDFEDEVIAANVAASLGVTVDQLVQSADTRQAAMDRVTEDAAFMQWLASSPEAQTRLDRFADWLDERFPAPALEPSDVTVPDA